MRKLTVFEHISLDGFMEVGPDGPHGGWTASYRTPAGLAVLMEAQGDSFDLLLGRRTYDLWAQMWPKAGNSPMATRLNAATKYVVTHRPDSLAWGPAKDMGANVTAGVTALKAQDGPDLVVWGSSTVTSVLLDQGLVDEVVLLVYPVLLGGGKQFFSQSDQPREFAFVRTKTSPTGILINTYRHLGAMKRDR